MQSRLSRLELVTPYFRASADFQLFQIELLLALARSGCIGVTCSSVDGGHRFVFPPLWKAGVARCV
jgi:hypothetical protein